MFDFLAIAAELFTSAENLLVLVLGTFVGIVLGALPGIGSTVAVAISLPFTFEMTAGQAITLLVGVYAGSVYGGSISAILINTPGTVQSAATSFDGYPMVRKGKAGEALGWATMASTFGGFISAIALIFIAPQLAALALHFGPIETFSLLMLGMVCIVAVSGQYLLRGLLAGALGMFLATVGGDPYTGEARLTFGYWQLMSGIDLIAAIIGLFALSEVLVQVADRAPDDEKTFKYSGMVLPRLRDWAGRKLNLIKSTLIGLVIGILPGTGAATAAFVSYAEANRSSPRKDNFGKGEPDGIIASESANNAVTGGALIPTMALGIPGDSVTAVMLGSFILHGITPGMNLMRDHGDTMGFIFMGFLFVNLLLLPLGMLIARFSAPLFRINKAYIMAGVVILCMLGTYLVRGNVFDLLVVTIAGGLGFILRKQNIPMAPIVIGMVLGPNIEMSLRQGLIITKGSVWEFLTGYPIALTLNIIVLLALFLPIILRKRKSKSK